MKVYILKEEDFEKLLIQLTRDPEHGMDGNSNDVWTPEEKRIHKKVFRFFNYQVRTWIDSVKKD